MNLKVSFPFAIVLAFALVSCNSNKGLSVEDQGEVLIEQYCSGDKYFSDTPSPIFFEIFRCFWINYRSLANSVYSENR